MPKTKIKVHSFDVAEDPVSADMYCANVGEMCATPEGANLYRPNLALLIKRDAKLHLAYISGGEIAAGCYTYVADDGVTHLSGLITKPECRSKGAADAVVKQAISHTDNQLDRARMALVVRYMNGAPQPGPVAVYSKVGFAREPGVQWNAISGSIHDRHLRDSAEPNGGYLTITMTRGLRLMNGGV